MNPTIITDVDDESIVSNFVFLKDLPLLSERASLTRQTRNLEQTAASAVSAHRSLSSAASRRPSSSPTFVRQRLMNFKFNLLKLCVNPTHVFVVNVAAE